jgi:hypothetical protein
MTGTREGVPMGSRGTLILARLKQAAEAGSTVRMTPSAGSSAGRRVGGTSRLTGEKDRAATGVHV